MKHKISTLFLVFIIFVFFTYVQTDELNFDKTRKEMVEKQIKARGIKDQKVINAMLKVKRHLFVKKEYWKQAYNDYPLPIGYGQTISQPYIVALMTEVAQLKETDRVLEIGTGSGYQAAILAEIVKEVYTIEIIKELGSIAEKRLKLLGYKNIKVKIGDGYKGWKEYSPFDVIIVTCAPSVIPPVLFEQLAENGRMVLPVGKEGCVQELYLVKKIKGKMVKEKILDVIFVPMIKGEE